MWVEEAGTSEERWWANTEDMDLGFYERSLREGTQYGTALVYEFREAAWMAHDVEGARTDVAAPSFAKYGDQNAPTCVLLASKASLLEPRSAKGVLGYSTEAPRKGVGGAVGLGATSPNALAPRKPGKDLRGVLRIGVVAVTECSVWERIRYLYRRGPDPSLRWVPAKAAG